MRKDYLVGDYRKWVENIAPAVHLSGPNIDVSELEEFMKYRPDNTRTAVEYIECSVGYTDYPYAFCNLEDDSEYFAECVHYVTSWFKECRGVPDLDEFIRFFLESQDDYEDSLSEIFVDYLFNEILDERVIPKLANGDELLENMLSV